MAPLCKDILCTYWFTSNNNYLPRQCFYRSTYGTPAQHELVGPPKKGKIFLQLKQHLAFLNGGRG